MVNGAERKMYDSLGPLLVVLRYKSKAKSDMVKWSQGGVLLVVSAWTDATSRTGQERWDWGGGGVGGERSRKAKKK